MKLFCIKDLPLQIDYKFERFMNKCLKLQKDKRSLEMQIRVELDNWRTLAKKGAPTVECRHRLSVFLKGFKAAQETQDLLIEKEKQRISSCENEYNKTKVHVLKNKLKFFAILNKQHEKLLEMVRQDVLDCRSICRPNSDDDDDDASRIRLVVSIFIYLKVLQIVFSNHPMKPCPPSIALYSIHKNNFLGGC